MMWVTSTRTALAIAFALAATGIAPAESARAQEQGAAIAPRPDPDSRGFISRTNEALAGVDGWFGRWVVGPLEAVIFWDVVFWDTHPDAIAARGVRAGLTPSEARRIGHTAGRLGTSSEKAQVAVCSQTRLPAEVCRDVVRGLQLPIIVLWLVVGAVFFTLRYAFINVRAFSHAIKVTLGRYDHDDDPGEVTHFQALASALSATVGLGNIAGVAVAVGVGGPGAVFWMVAAGFFGMSSKFTECTLGQMYRSIDRTGRVLGGPMRYLSVGITEVRSQGNTPGWRRLGKALAFVFAVLCIGGSFGGGNMFQANQSAKIVVGQLMRTLRVDSVAVQDFSQVVYGVVLAALVGVVIIGGIRRIGTVAGYLVPAMCVVYMIAGAIVLITHAGELSAAAGKIVGEAFSPRAGLGGMLGVLVQGVRRAGFSNEAGVGSAPIAHSAAATTEPVREGIVALLEPFIDTIVVCSMTGLVLVITGAYEQQGADGTLLDDIEMTRWAFDSTLPGFSWVLAPAVFLFAFSTMLSWSYYGERCWSYLFGAGERASLSYRAVFLAFVILGTIIDVGNVVTFSDLMILGMAFPNILGLFLLSGRVSQALDDYWGRFRSGEMSESKRARG